MSPEGRYDKDPGGDTEPGHGPSPHGRHSAPGLGPEAVLAADSLLRPQEHKCSLKLRGTRNCVISKSR